MDLIQIVHKQQGFDSKNSIWLDHLTNLVQWESGFVDAYE